MDISIKSYQASTQAKLSTQEKLPSSNPVNLPSGDAALKTTETVTISDSARALYALSNADDKQASMSNRDLKGQYAKGQSDMYNFGQRIAGGNLNNEDLLPKTDDPTRLALGLQSLDYAIGLSKLPPEKLPNPFEGMARNGLSNIVYDDSGTYTDAERYAAYGELSKQDETYFSKLYANITNGGDNSEIFKGIMDYFDDLPGVEKAAYPDGFRDSIKSLYQEQLGQSGPLALLRQSTENDSDKLSPSFFNKEQSPEQMLQAVLEKATALSTI
ncbi:hypothetical protein ACWHY4_28110 [Pseudomonas sp. E2-15]